MHILAENQGNLQAAVMDLLRCDTLDWEQYPAVYNSRYVDVDAWSPEEISSFQDAIYKSEKDFQQVAAEVRENPFFFYYSISICSSATARCTSVWPSITHGRRPVRMTTGNCATCGGSGNCLNNRLVCPLFFFNFFRKIFSIYL